MTLPQTYADPLKSGALVSSIRIDDAEISSSIAAIGEVTIDLREGHHDRAVISLQFQQSQIDSYTNKPISFTYGPPERFGRFYGYVTSPMPTRGYKSDLALTLECTGITWTMRYGQPRFWRDRQAELVVKELVEGYHLGLMLDEFLVENRGYRWHAIGQTDETDFQMCTKLAQRLGFCLFVTDGVVRLVDPVKALRTTGAFVTLTQGDEVNDNTRDLFDWAPSTQSLETRVSQLPRYAYFGKAGASYSAAYTSADETERFETHHVVTDPLMAQAHRQAWSTRPRRWSQQATARIRGHAGVLPGTLVNISTSTSSVIRNDYDGLWLVLGVKHSLTQGSFQSELTLAREPTFSRRNVGDYREWYQASRLAQPLITRRSLPGGSFRWESSWAGQEASSLSTSTAGATGTVWKGTTS